MSFKFLEETIENLKEAELFRNPPTFSGEQAKLLKMGTTSVLNFCSNDYLGFCSRPEIREAIISAVKSWGSGSGASRLVTGSMEPHMLLERKLADFEKKESSVIFPTGYMANVGTISALLEAQDTVIIDRLNHASIIDGARLSGAKLCVYPHRDMNKLESILKRIQNKRRKLIVTDGVFSMDGDLAPLRDIAFLKNKYDAILMVDEAHGTGVFGNSGSGLSEALGVKDDVDVLMGTFSKAVGVLGGFVAGSKYLTDYIVNKARSYIYTTSSPPAICAGAMKALELIKEEPEARERLIKNSKWLRDGIKRIGLDCMDSQSQIIPIMVGDTKKTLAYSKFLFGKGIFVQAIRPPTVPTSRLRITVSALHEREDIEYLLEILKNVDNV